MVQRRLTTRAFWLMLAIAGLFSMFTVQSTNTLKFNHVPGRLYARAGGTVSSLSQRERVEEVAAQSAQADESPSFDLTLVILAAQISTQPIRQRAESVPAASPLRWPPLLLFRPPPALSVA